VETRRYLRLPVRRLLEDGCGVSTSVHDIDPETVADFDSEEIAEVVAETMCNCDEDDCPTRGLYAVLGVSDGIIVAAANELDADAASRLFLYATRSWGEREVYESTGMGGRACVVAERPDGGDLRGSTL
jgi:hypothetical protein